MSDIKTLARQAANGDKKAFDSLYEHTKNGVWFTCIQLLKNEENAKDIMQDTYLTAFEKLSALPNFDGIQGWLNKIAVNKCKDRLKSSAVSKLAEESKDIIENIPDESLFPEEYVMNKAKRAIIMDITESKLSEAQSRTIILYYFDEMTAAEIAEIMGCHEKTVLYRLKTAKAKIKEEVLKYENENNDKLHAIVPIPILTRLLKAEAESTSVPNVPFINESSDASQNVPENSAANAADSGGTKMLNSLKAKIIAGACAIVVVGGGVTAGVLISNNSKNNTESVFSRPYLSSESMGNNNSKLNTSQTSNYSQSTESVNSTPATENAEYPQIEGLSPVELIRTDENKSFRDPDIISGTIKDAMLDDFLFLTKDGELVMYYNDGRDYQPISFGKDTGISRLDNAFFEHDGNEFVVLAVDGKNVFFKSVNRDGEVNVCRNTGNAREIKGTLFNDRDMQSIRVDAFGDIYAFDENGMGFEVSNIYRTDEERTPKDDAVFADEKKGFFYYPKYANGRDFNEMKVKQLANRCFIADDNKIYYHRPGSTVAEKTPIESLTEFSFESIYYSNSCHILSVPFYSAVTTDGTIKVFSTADESDIKVVFSAPKPEGTIQNIWNTFNDKVIVKTDKGLYFANYETDTEFKPVQSLNGIDEEVISLSGYYVLLSNGCVYTVDEFRG